MPEPPKDTRFKKGQSGNPKGKPRGRTLTTMLREFLSEEVSGNKGFSYGDMIVRKLVQEAMKGNVKATDLIMDRVDGKVSTPVQVDGVVEVKVTGKLPRGLAIADD